MRKRRFVGGSQKEIDRNMKERMTERKVEAKHKGRRIERNRAWSEMKRDRKFIMKNICLKNTASECDNDDGAGDNWRR